MSKKEEYIENYNSLATEPACEEYSNETVRIMDIVNDYVNEYKIYKQDYSNIPKLNLSYKIDFLNFYEKENLFRIALLGPNDDIAKQLNEKYEVVLNIKKKNDEYHAFIDNCSNPYSDDFKRIDCNLDSSILEKYYNLGKKYNKFMDVSYDIHSFGGSFTKNEGYIMLYIKCDGNITNDIKKISVSFGECYTDYEVTFDVDDELEVSNIQNISGEFDFTNAEVIDILENLYINKNDVCCNLYDICINKEDKKNNKTYKFNK